MDGEGDREREQEIKCEAKSNWVCGGRWNYDKEQKEGSWKQAVLGRSR